MDMYRSLTFVVGEEIPLKNSSSLALFNIIDRTHTLVINSPTPRKKGY